MILQIVGNVPGLQNAGAMWAGEFTGFLLDFGFTQSITDRRLFHLTDENGLLLIVGAFVDDCKVVVQSESKAAEYTKAWEERYRDPPRRRGNGARFFRAQVQPGRSGDLDQLQQGDGRSR